MKIQHLALAVKDQEKSRRFYEKYFGFNTKSAKMYEDYVLILRDSSGFVLALGPVDNDAVLPKFLHFGFTANSPKEVAEVKEKLVHDGLRIVEEHNETDYVSIKTQDPDGYVVEAFWEPEE